MTKQPIRTKLFTTASEKLDKEMEKELQVPDPEPSDAVGVFIEGVAKNEDTDEHDRSGDDSDN